MSQLNQALHWRYATKRMNGQGVPADKINSILEAIRLSASSLGLQPYRVVVVDDVESKNKIHAQACQQPQVLECSHLLVFATATQIDTQMTSDYVQRVATERAIPFESEPMQGFLQMVNGYVIPRTPEQLGEWAARQAYIGLGTGLAAAALEQVDATPMEGFDPAQMDAILGLSEKGLTSRVLLALGYRDAANDYLAQAKKVRLPAEKFFIKPN